jgi:type III secretion protein R
MAPVFEKSFSALRTTYESRPTGAQIVAGIEPALEPLKQFLEKHGAAEERGRFLEMARELRATVPESQVTENDWTVVLPAFVITELKEAFTLGFLVFLPFLVVDMLVANVLLALGMQTLSPTQVSLPFKILLFVAVDGWSLLARGLILGYR